MEDHKLSSDKTVVAQELETSNEQEQEQYPSGWRLAVIIASLCLGTLLIAIDNTILAVAIPKITTLFNSLNDIGWYGSAYLLSITALQPTFGNIYKYFDVKIIYLISIVIFEGTMICTHPLSLSLLTWVTSWFNYMRCSSGFADVHSRSSHCRRRCGRAISRSFGYRRTHSSFGETTNVPKYRCECFRPCNLLRTCARRRIYKQSQLEMVLLDVRIFLHSANLVRAKVPIATFPLGRRSSSSYCSSSSSGDSETRIVPSQSKRRFCIWTCLAPAS